MNFQISGLPRATFAPLFGASDAVLATHGAVRQTVTAKPGTPCRVSLADAEIGETVLLVHYEHQSAATPYRASHAVFVREGAAEYRPEPGEIPPVLASRLLSVRGFDADGMMVAADVVAGHDLRGAIAAMFEDGAAYLHLHNAKPGCFAARVDRA